MLISLCDPDREYEKINYTQRDNLHKFACLAGNPNMKWCHKIFPPDKLREYIKNDPYFDPVSFHKKLETIEDIYHITRFRNLKKVDVDLILPQDFNPTAYTNLHKDLNNLDDMEAKIHYLVYGRKEGRVYNTGLPETL